MFGRAHYRQEFPDLALDAVAFAGANSRVDAAPVSPASRLTLVMVDATSVGPAA
jgi:hypothetical protein